MGFEFAAAGFKLELEPVIIWRGRERGGGAAYWIAPQLITNQRVNKTQKQ